MVHFFLLFYKRFKVFFFVPVTCTGLIFLHGCSTSDVDDSVVMVITVAGKYKPRIASFGSGFVVAHGGYIVTNYHVIDDALNSNYKELFILTEGHNSKPYPTSIEWYSASLDLAILRVPELNAPPLKVNSGDLQKLDSVTTIGFPAAAESFGYNRSTITISSHAKGEVSRVFTPYRRSYGRHVHTVQHNALVNSGNSGGPLINACGEVVGVNTWSSKIGQGTFFSSHASELVRVLKMRKIPAYITETRCSGPGAKNTTIWFVVLAILFLIVLLTVGILFIWPTVRKKLFGGSSFDEGEYERLSSRDNRETELVGAGEKAGQVYQLRSVNGYEVFPLDPAMIGQSPVVIGRTAGLAGIEIDKPDISRQHARITVCVYDPNKLCLEDLKSRNGTRINGEPLSPGASPMIMRVGDNIQVGNQNFVFGRYSAQESARNVVQQTQTTRGRVEADGWVLRGSDRATGVPISIDVGPDEMRSRNNQLVIGRNSDHCDIVIADPTVSSKGHAKIVFQNNEYRIADMGSTNGTRVDREKLEPGVNMAVLRDNMVLQLGSVELRVERRQG